MSHYQENLVLKRVQQSLKNQVETQQMHIFNNAGCQGIGPPRKLTAFAPEVVTPK